jgi:ABC-type dipeptide/oligopeptide/nickel transport system permease subunit
MTEFWKEFARHKMGVLGLTVLLVYVGMAITAPMLVAYDPSPSNKIAPSFLAPSWMQVFDPEGVVTGEVIDNVYLDEEPDGILKAGTHTDQFSSNYYQGSGGDDYSHMSLSWNHEANGSLDFVLPRDPQSDTPSVEDYIYFYEVIEWEKERLPSDVNMSLEYNIVRTGDFLSRSDGGLMFKVYMWLIDSSDNWRKVYESYPPYTETFQERRVDLSYFDVAAGWGGMVANETDYQEDPYDTLKIAIGLAPTFMMRTHLEYEGSVTVNVKKLSAVAYGAYFGLLGTTDKGADAWSQLVYGSRISLTIGILATALSTGVGVIVGMTAGYFGGKIDEALMRIVDFLLVIPGLPLMMVLAAFLGPSVQNIIIVIAILGWTGTSRLIRSQVMAEKNKAYVESAKAIGASDTYIIYRHILPNVTPILFADITLGVVGAILSESGLAFLGLTDPSEPSWGRMLSDAQGAGGFSNGAWWVVVFPGAMITILSLAFTFVGHTLDHVLNPRLRER